MAARKTAIGKGTMPENWREKIRTSMLVNRLHDHVEGKVELTKSQVSAALGLLKKSLPDLSSTAIGQDPELGPIKHEAIERPRLTREEWLEHHKGN